MFHIIYKTINLVNNRYYIGKHSTNDLNDSYLGSGTLLRKAIRRYGKENFQREILFVFDNPDDMSKKEAEIVTEQFCRSDENYNLACGGEGGFGYINTNQDKLYNPFHDPDAKAKIDMKARATMIERYGENYLTVIAGMQEYPEERKAAISKRQTENNSYKGKKHSPEVIERMKRNKNIFIYDENGDRYNSIKEMCDKTGLSGTTVRKRVNNGTYRSEPKSSSIST